MIRENRARGTTAPAPGGPLVIGRKTGAGEMNVGPALSPDGTRIAFLSSRDQLSIDLYLADATTGKIIKRLVVFERRPAGIARARRDR